MQQCVSARGEKLVEVFPVGGSNSSKRASLSMAVKRPGGGESPLAQQTSIRK